MSSARHESRSPPTAGRSRSLLNRIAGPLQPKPRHITDLRIETADPHRVYSPGDAVKGIVHFTSLKPLRLTHAVLQIHGFVKVYKNATPPGEGISANAAAYSSLAARKSGRGTGPGFATIFEDERVICGTGSLSPGRYEIPFHLELPQESMPSSLDFERGTISYVLVAILTRPTTVAPTIAAERKIEVRETIDVATMSEPKQRSVSLRPVHRRPKARGASKDERDLGSSLTSPSTNVSMSERESSRGRRSPSEHSAASGGSGTSAGARGTSATFEVSEADLSTEAGNKRISASVDLLREGYLPGDLVPVRVTVKHNRAVKAMQGVIVTLYRRAKIDLLDGADSKEGAVKDELPRPRGLSGLFFGAGVMSHTFRYDLDQSVVPLVINPNTMQGEVKTAVRIPEDVFPSITCVPMGLMSFTYHVEVVMDLMAKLSGMDRFLPRLSMTHTHAGYGFDIAARDSDAHGASSVSGPFLDTTNIRRLDTIAHCTFDAVVGTKDSGRRPARRTADPWTEAQRQFGSLDQAAPPSVEGQGSNDSRSATAGPDQADDQPAQQPRGDAAPPHIPPPEPEPSPANEKERMRLAEEQLLPSQPDEDSSSAAGPSAPYLSTIDEQTPAYQAPAVPPPTDADHGLSEKERQQQHEAALLPSRPDGDEAGPSASAPQQDTFDASGPAQAPLDPAAAMYQGSDEAGPSSAAPPYAAGGPAHGDDKQELERQRLQAQASAPDDDGSDDDAPEGGEEAAAPSAPVFDEEHASGEQRAWEQVDGENLPEYQR